MPCYHPMFAWRAKGPNPKTGKIPMVFKAELAADPTDQQEMPCGQCVGCRLERSRQWAMRCTHEASLYEDNCFITLTYDNEHLPENLSLNKRELQLFWKKLRKKYPNKVIRYYACGEYGDRNNRPHYHACIFNHDFEDKKLWTTSNGNNLYTSEILQSLWPQGYNIIGNVTFDSAAYVARYIMKKVTGKKAKQNSPYNYVNDTTGEIHRVIPEFNTMSRRPGIGTEWFKKFKSDAYPKDYLMVNGEKMKPPKFYDGLYELDEPEKLEAIKLRRKEYAETFSENNTADRLRVREKVKQIQAKILVRPEQ